MNTKEVYKSNYTSIVYDETNAFFEVKRTISVDLDEDTYKQDFLGWLKVIQTYRPYGVLMIEAQNEYLIVPELQTWINQNVLKPAWEAGVRRLAFLVSEDFIVHLSHEQTMEENSGRMFQTNYFDDIQKAKEWLKNK
jgi:hypothetical protein